MTLSEMRDYGVEWWRKTGRKPYCNYCVDGKNNSILDFDNLRNLFPPNVFNFTFSVVCSSDETMKSAGYRNIDDIEIFEACFIEDYIERNEYFFAVFDPRSIVSDCDRNIALPR